MKQLFYKNLLYCTFILLSINVCGQSRASKEIKNTFSLTDNGALFLSNKYGDIFINGWDKDSIQILTDIEVKGKKIDRAKELLNRISTNIVNSKNQVIVKSEITKKEATFFSKYFDKMDPFKSEKSNTNINYTINLPRFAEIEVLNKYGDIIISGWNGKLNADVEHGDIRITDSIATSKISVSYGELKANVLNETSIKAKDASVSFNNTEILKLDSDGSEINIESVSRVDLNSNKDHIQIDTVNHVNGNAKFSKIVLNNVTSKVNLSLNLAELRVLKLETHSPIVHIHQKSSEVYINISGTSFNFGAELEQGVLRIPKTMNNVTSKVLDKKNKIRQIRANYGKKGKGIFDITGFKGTIIFKEL